MAEYPPLLEIDVARLFGEDFQRGRCEAAAYVAAKTVFPQVGIDKLSIEQAQWQASFPFRDTLAPGGLLWAQADRNYRKCQQIGRTLLAWLNSQFEDAERLSLAEAKRQQARPITDSALEKHWRTCRHVAHFCGAHVEFERLGRCYLPGVLSFPCDLQWLPEFLLFAESLRLTAVRFELPRADTLWTLPATALRHLRENTPANRTCGIDPDISRALLSSTRTNQSGA